MAGFVGVAASAGTDASSRHSVGSVVSRDMPQGGITGPPAKSSGKEPNATMRAAVAPNDCPRSTLPVRRTGGGADCGQVSVGLGERRREVRGRSAGLRKSPVRAIVARSGLIDPRRTERGVRSAQPDRLVPLRVLPVDFDAVASVLMRRAGSPIRRHHE